MGAAALGHESGCLFQCPGAQLGELSLVMGTVNHIGIGFHLVGPQHGHDGLSGGQIFVQTGRYYPIIGAVIGALVLVLVKPAFALWFLIFTIGIQILDAYVIKPRLFSSSFGMAPVWTLISITVGGNLFGIVGVLLAIPVAAILSFIYDEKFIPWLQRKSEARARRAAELAEEEAAAAAPGEFAASQESAESDIKTAEE